MLAGFCAKMHAGFGGRHARRWTATHLRCPQSQLVMLHLANALPIVHTLPTLVVVCSQGAEPIGPESHRLGTRSPVGRRRKDSMSELCGLGSGRTTTWPPFGSCAASLGRPPVGLRLAPLASPRLHWSGRGQTQLAELARAPSEGVVHRVHDDDTVTVQFVPDQHRRASGERNTSMPARRIRPGPP